MAEYKIGSIRNSISLKEDCKKQSVSKRQKLINYTELRTLKSNKDQKFLPGLMPASKTFIHKPSSKSKQQCLQREQPKLLTTAVSMIRQKYQSHENLQNENVSNGLSNYFSISRQITPINPLVGSLHNNTHLSKRRMKTHQTIKSRLQSITSDHHQLESHGQSVGNLLPPHKQKDFTIYDRVLGQSQAAYHYAFGKQRKVPQKLIYLWKQCLFHQDKNQIFVPVNPQESNNIPYTHPRIFPLNELEKGFQEVYGTGKHRCLKIGEEALIIEGVQKYLQKCCQQPTKIARKDYDIISEILGDCKLSELENYPMCYRQIEAHFKIMATRWKYQNMKNKTNKMLEPAIINGKNNFVDLGKTGILSDYLLKNSNRKELI